MPIIDVDGPANTALVTTAETIVATIAGGVNTRAGSQVVLQGNVQITTGVATTSITLRVRRGALVTSPLVGQAFSAAAAATVPFNGEIQVDDVPGEVAGQSYVLTAQQVSATGNGTATAANLRAEF